jgi:hypothetical protein
LVTSPANQYLSTQLGWQNKGGNSLNYNNRHSFDSSSDLPRLGDGTAVLNDRNRCPYSENWYTETYRRVEWVFKRDIYNWTYTDNRESASDPSGATGISSVQEYVQYRAK